MEKSAIFKRELAKSGKDFLALSPLPALKVQFQFTGKLRDQEVIWDATAQTLASHLAENPPAKAGKKPPDVRSFMQVQAPRDGFGELRVVLAMPLIDEPAIRKIIIMIRCYKRLKAGYHELGKNL